MDIPHLTQLYSTTQYRITIPPVHWYSPALNLENSWLANIFMEECLCLYNRMVNSEGMWHHCWKWLQNYHKFQTPGATTDFEIGLEEWKIQLKVKSTGLHTVWLRKGSARGQEAACPIEVTPKTSPQNTRRKTLFSCFPTTAAEVYHGLWCF